MPEEDTRLVEQCLLFDVHRLGRAMTSLYNAYLRETDLTIAQFTLLRNIAAMAPVGMTEIAEAMLMDRTSVTRLIEPLVKRDLIATEAAQDKRRRNVVVTRRGLATVAKSEKAWRDAQSDLLARVGPEQWRGLRGALRQTLRLVRETEDGPDLASH